jgi:hypothetical protein
MSYHLRRWGLIALGILVSVTGPSVALAQSSEGLQIKPAIIEDNVTLGGFQQYSITVHNIATEDKTFFLTTEDIKGLDDQGLPVFAQPGEQTGYELSSWIALPQGAVTLKAGDTKTISFSVRVPNQASPGAHFGAIMLTNKPTAPGTSGSGIGYSVANIISLTIAGDVREEAQLREFSTDKIIYGTPSVNFISKIENLGNALVRPHGIITITDMFGRQVGSQEVNASAAPVFPGSTRKYAVTWDAKGFAFGRYEAVAAFSYGDTEKKTISGTTSFWVLPLKPIAIVLGVLLALILGMYFAIRMYIRRKLQDMGISSDSSDANYYARKYQRSGSRMIVVTLIVFVVCVLFLAVIFLAFA